MKKTLLVVSTLLFSAILVNEDATGLSRLKNKITNAVSTKDDLGRGLNAGVSGISKSISNLESVNKEFSKLIEASSSSKNPVEVNILIPINEVIDTAVATFKLFYSELNNILIGYNNYKKADIELEKAADSTRKTERAEGRQSEAITRLENGFRNLASSGIESQCTNLKGNILVCISMMRAKDPTNLDDKLRKKIRKLVEELSKLRPTLSQLSGICKKIGDETEQEINLEKIKKAIDTLIIFVDFMQEIDVIIESGEEATATDFADIEDRCLPDDTAKKQLKKKGQTTQRAQKRQRLEDDDEYLDDEEERLPRKRKKISDDYANDDEYLESDEDEDSLEEESSPIKGKQPQRNTQQKRRKTLLQVRER